VSGVGPCTSVGWGGTAGAPGAGKSTLIRRHRLDGLAVGLDDFRRLFSAVFTDLDGAPTLAMTFGAEKQVVAAS